MNKYLEKVASFGNSELHTRVSKLVGEYLGARPNEVTPHTTFKSLGADELDLAELHMALEEEFEREIPDKAAHGFHTVGHVVKYLSSKQ